jgi:hypothetical protein
MCTSLTPQPLHRTEIHGSAARCPCQSRGHEAVPGCNARTNTNAGLSLELSNYLLVASLGCCVERARRTPSRPARARVYLLILKPALAEIVGEGRPWTVLMISLLSMPCR